MLPSCLPARTFIPPPRPRPVETGGRRSRNNRLRQRPLTRCQRRLTVRGVARAFRPAPAARTKPRGRRSRARLRGPQNEIYGCSPAPGQRRKGVGFVVPSCAPGDGSHERRRTTFRTARGQLPQVRSAPAAAARSISRGRRSRTRRTASAPGATISLCWRAGGRKQLNGSEFVLSHALSGRWD